MVILAILWGNCSSMHKSASSADLSVARASAIKTIVDRVSKIRNYFINVFCRSGNYLSCLQWSFY